MDILIKTTLQSIILIFIVGFYTRIFKFNYKDIKYSNSYKSLILAIVAIILSIIITIIYNKYFINVFPVNTTFNLLIMRLILATPAIICMVINKEKINTVGFTKDNLLKSIILGFLIGCIYFFTYSTKSLDVMKNINLKSINTLTNLFIYCLVIGIGEEFLYRGYLQTRIMNTSGKINGWLLTAIIFTLVHFPQRIIVDRLGVFQALISCAYLLPISLLLGYTSMKTKNLTSSIICHAFIDWTSFIFMSIK